MLKVATPTPKAQPTLPPFKIANYTIKALPLRFHCIVLLKVILLAATHAIYPKPVLIAP